MRCWGIRVQRRGKYRSNEARDGPHLGVLTAAAAAAAAAVDAFLGAADDSAAAAADDARGAVKPTAADTARGGVKPTAAADDDADGFCRRTCRD